MAAQRALEGELLVLARTLSYGRAADLGRLVTQAVLSSRGQLQVDERTNTLLITDLGDRLEAAQELLDTLDRAEPQVEIEARIVQARTRYARELGIRWGVTGRLAPDIGNTTPLTFPNRGGLTGRVGGSQGPHAGAADERAGAMEDAGTAVNLGVLAATSALGLTLGAVDGSLNPDVVLSAAEHEGQVETLSHPRVTTQNNVQATIVQGDQIPIQTVANNTVTVQFKDAALRLAVTPQIAAADTVILQLEIDNDFVNYGRIGERRSADRDAARGDDGASGRRRHDGHRWHLPAREPAPNGRGSRPQSDPVARAVVQTPGALGEHRRADDLPDASHRAMTRVATFAGMRLRRLRASTGRANRPSGGSP